MRSPVLLNEHVSRLAEVRGASIETFEVFISSFKIESLETKTQSVLKTFDGTSWMSS